MNATVYFEDIQNVIVNTLKDAKFSITVAVAWFTDKVLLDILIQKANSGLHTKVMVIDDLINSSLNFANLESVGGKIYKVNESLMHHKFCIVDGDTVITGSYNWTNKANLSNHENIIITRNDPNLAGMFLREFHHIVSKYFRKPRKDSYRWEWILPTEKDGKYGLEDLKKELIVPYIYDNIWSIEEGVFWVRIGSLCGVVSYLNAKPCECVYLANVEWDDGWVEYPPFYADEMLLVQKENKKYGFLDLYGEEAIPCIYSNARDFYKGRAYVEDGSRSGYIDKNGVFV